MLVNRRKRWASIGPTLYQRLVFTGMATVGLFRVAGCMVAQCLVDA